MRFIEGINASLKYTIHDANDCLGASGSYVFPELAGKNDAFIFMTRDDTTESTSQMTNVFMNAIILNGELVKCVYIQNQYLWPFTSSSYGKTTGTLTMTSQVVRSLRRLRIVTVYV